MLYQNPKNNMFSDKKIVFYKLVSISVEYTINYLAGLILMFVTSYVRNKRY